MSMCCLEYQLNNTSYVVLVIDLFSGSMIQQKVVKKNVNQLL